MAPFVTQALSSLARLTLRQLRQMASDLGVTLYSRKSKEALVSAIAERQGRKSSTAKTIESEFSPAASSESKTRVVFLPRDPQWAYVFWEISDNDRKRAQTDGAAHLSLRLADVTGIQDGSSHPHTLQEVPVDSHSTEWYLPVPLCDRDYRVGVGLPGWCQLDLLGLLLNGSRSRPSPQRPDPGSVRSLQLGRNPCSSSRERSRECSRRRRQQSA